MIRKNYMLVLAILSLYFVAVAAQPKHDKWDMLLQKHVSNDGFVNYNGFKKDLSVLETYLLELNNTPPKKEWAEEEKLSYWINLYNAATVKLIVSNVPLKSIRDIETKKGISPWKMEFVKSGGKTYTLDAVEHEILRKDFNTPLIHFGVNCASFSCPILHNHAFTASNVKAELEQLAKRFVNDSQRNKVVSKDSAQLSQLFSWFEGDFTKTGSLIDFINKYSKIKLNKNAKISFSEYNWQLNSQK